MVADVFTKPMEESFFLRSLWKIIFNEDDTYENYGQKVNKCQDDTLLEVQ